METRVDEIHDGLGIAVSTADPRAKVHQIKIAIVTLENLLDIKALRGFGMPERTWT